MSVDESGEGSTRTYGHVASRASNSLPGSGNPRKTKESWRLDAMASVGRSDWPVTKFTS